MCHTRWAQLPLWLVLTTALPGVALAEGHAAGLQRASPATVARVQSSPGGRSSRGDEAAVSPSTQSPSKEQAAPGPTSIQTAAPVAAPSVGGGATASATVDEPLRVRLEAMAGQGRPTLAPRFPHIVLASVPVLEELYRRRGFLRVWQRQVQVSDLLGAIARTSEDGLDPGDFHPKGIKSILGEKGLAGLSGDARDDADLLLTDSLLRYIHDRLYGKVDPVAIDRKLHYADAPTLEALATRLGAALDASDLGDHLRHLVQEPPFYARLKEGLARCRGDAADGGWGSVPTGGKLAPGARDERVSALRERLRASGDYQGAAPADPKVYDKGLAEAVKAFQKLHGLVADGVVGGRTLVELNVPAEQRVEQIRVNLERMRWVYHDLPQDYLLVDVVGFRVYLMRGGDTQWSAKAQVGRADRQTPAFRDQVEYLEINPTWTVPPTILKDDILPKARVNPGYVAKKGLKAIDRSGRRVPLSAVNWNLPASTFPYVLRQDGGGDKAALGKIKFMFPNRFSVYLHDTPHRNLFDQPVRMTSSGCVRVDQPFELAERVLGDPERWTVDSLKGLVDSGKTRTVRLKEPLAIILAYWTADGLGDGKIRFREDRYGRDAAVLTALDTQTRIRVTLPQPPQPVPPPAPAEPDAPTEANAVPVTRLPAPEVAAKPGSVGAGKTSRL
jgi:murein L,D-transpeptidase YcbB/YkuD